MYCDAPDAIEWVQPQMERLGGASPELLAACAPKIDDIGAIEAISDDRKGNARPFIKAL